MTSLMIDFETLSTQPNAAVFCLGGVFFDSTGLLGEGFETFIDIEEQLAKGRHVSSDTLRWWLGQSEVARRNMITGMAKAVTISYFAKSFLSFIAAYPPKNLLVWSNGGDFDIPILSSLLHDCGVSAPWPFWNHRCHRTLMAIAGIRKPAGATVHTALQDSKDQALLAIEAANKLGLTL